MISDCTAAMEQHSWLFRRMAVHPVKPSPVLTLPALIMCACMVTMVRIALPPVIPYELHWARQVQGDQS